MDNMSYSVPVMPATTGMNDGLFGSGGTGSFILGLLFGGRWLFGGYGAGTGCGNPCVGEANSAALTGLATQVSEIQSQLNTNTLINGQEDISNDINNGIRSLCTNLDNIGRDTLSGLGSVQTSIANANFQTLNSINGAVGTITNQNNQAALQNLNSFNNLTTTTLQGFNEVGRDLATATNQIIMGQNNAASQLAACCCDIKQTISNDGNLTRALINDIRVGDLQTQLQDAKSQISNLSQTSLLQNELCGLRASIAELKCCACGIPSQNAVSNRVI